LRRAPPIPDPERQHVRDELRDQRRLCDETSVELGLWESLEQRAQPTAVVGLLLLLIAGLACQVASLVVAG
jgi:hypothetical protein